MSLFCITCAAYVLKRRTLIDFRLYASMTKMHGLTLSNIYLAVSQQRKFWESFILFSKCTTILSILLCKPLGFVMLFLPDEENDNRSDFLGFSVYISPTARKEDGVLCFRDTNYTRATIPNPVNITCPNPGRYVIYYNNRTHKPFPYGYSLYTYSDLCEVEVYGSIFFKFHNMLIFLFIWWSI